MKSDDLRDMPVDRPIILHNKNCVYCGEELSTDTETKEHVIGRRFVPKGKFNNQWNLIVKACLRCNGLKGELEDEISAVTLQPDALGRHVSDDDVLANESERKAKGSISSLTGKPIKNSLGKFKIKGKFGAGANYEISFVSPPAINPERVYLLAGMHNMGFFYLITYNEESRRGGFWPGDHFPFAMAPRSDWGNIRIMSFVNRVADWKVKVVGHAADGYFRIVIRRHPEAECWAWAQEWNKNYRIVGLFGEPEIAQMIISEIPNIDAKEAPLVDGGNLKVWMERRLSNDEDRMFECG